MFVLIRRRLRFACSNQARPRLLYRLTLVVAWFLYEMRIACGARRAIHGFVLRRTLFGCSLVWQGVGAGSGSRTPLARAVGLDTASGEQEGPSILLGSQHHGVLSVCPRSLAGCPIANFVWVRVGSRGYLARGRAAGQRAREGGSSA